MTEAERENLETLIERAEAACAYMEGTKLDAETDIFDLLDAAVRAAKGGS